MERWRILHKETDFTVIDNGIFRDRDLTLAERGFLCTILSFPDSWEFSTKGMCEILQEGISAVQATINRLIKHGYCKKVRIFDPKTRRIAGYEYTFYEVKNGLLCSSSPQSDFPHMENPAMEIPAMENQHQYNTKESSTKESNTKKEYSRFDFLKALKSIGVSDEVAHAWMQVRKTKRATNTEIAFNSIKREIDNSGRPADECIRTAVERSWSGFKAEWMPKQPARSPLAGKTITQYLQEKGLI